jgi:hypothetical protein
MTNLFKLPNPQPSVQFILKAKEKQMKNEKRFRGNSHTTHVELHSCSHFKSKEISNI